MKALEERGKKIEKRMNSLYKKRKSEVLQIAKQQSRLDINFKRVSKGELISEILETEFGRGYYEKLQSWKKLKKNGEKIAKTRNRRI